MRRARLDQAPSVPASALVFSHNHEPMRFSGGLQPQPSTIVTNMRSSVLGSECCYFVIASVTWFLCSGYYALVDNVACVCIPVSW